MLNSVLLSQLVSPFSSLFLLLPYKRQLPGQEEWRKLLFAFWECFDIRPEIPHSQEDWLLQLSYSGDILVSVLWSKSRPEWIFQGLLVPQLNANTCLLNWFITIPRFSPEAAEFTPRKKEAEARSHELRERMEIQKSPTFSNWGAIEMFSTAFNQLPTETGLLGLIISDSGRERKGSWGLLWGKHLSVSQALEPNPTGYGEVLHILHYSNKTEYVLLIIFYLWESTVQFKYIRHGVC